jgi:hypothetical protein
VKGRELALAYFIKLDISFAVWGYKIARGLSGRLALKTLRAWGYSSEDGRMHFIELDFRNVSRAEVAGSLSDMMGGWVVVVNGI